EDARRRIAGENVAIRREVPADQAALSRDVDAVAGIRGGGGARRIHSGIAARERAGVGVEVDRRGDEPIEGDGLHGRVRGACHEAESVALAVCAVDLDEWSAAAVVPGL